MIPKKGDAIHALVGGAITMATDGSHVVFHDGQTPPTEKAIQAKLTELQADYDAKKYQRDRLQEYPNTNDLIVALWEKVMEGRSESADALEVKRQEVKTAHPKPE